MFFSSKRASIHQPMPIIVGSPRSGTTLLRLMLDSHSELAIPPETPFLTQEQRLQQQQRTTKPPDPACVFAWKQTMDHEERRRFQTVAGDLLAELGYEP